MPLEQAGVAEPFLASNKADTVAMRTPGAGGAQQQSAAVSSAALNGALAFAALTEGGDTMGLRFPCKPPARWETPDGGDSARGPPGDGDAAGGAIPDGVTAEDMAAVRRLVAGLANAADDDSAKAYVVARDVQDLPVVARISHKLCRKCCVSKPVEDFYYNVTRHDGLSCYCKPCHSEVGRRYRATKRDGTQSSPELCVQGDSREAHSPAHGKHHPACSACRGCVPVFCGKCGVERPAEDYHRGRARADGLAYLCKACGPNRSPVLEPTVEHKLCSKCGVKKWAEDFYRSKTRCDGLSFYCKPCHNDMRRRKRASDVEAIRSAPELCFQTDDCEVSGVQQSVGGREAAVLPDNSPDASTGQLDVVVRPGADAARSVAACSELPVPRPSSIASQLVERMWSSSGDSHRGMQAEISPNDGPAMGSADVSGAGSNEAAPAWLTQYTAVPVQPARPEVIDLTLSSSSEASAAGSGDSESENVDILGSDWDGDEFMSLQSLPRAGSERPRPDDDAADAAAGHPAAAAQGSGGCGTSQRDADATPPMHPRPWPSAVQQEGGMAERTDGCLLLDTGATESAGRGATYAAGDLTPIEGRLAQVHQSVDVQAPRLPRTKLTARKTTQSMARKSTPWQHWVEPSLDRRAPASVSPSQPELPQSQSVAQAPPLKLSAEPAPGDQAPESSADAADSTQTISRSPDQLLPIATSATGVLLESVLREAAELAEIAVPQQVDPSSPPECGESASLTGHLPPCSAAQQQGQQCDGHGASSPPRRPPRAAAPKPGQLRDLMRIEQQIRQQQHLHATTAATKRKASTRWPASKRAKRHAAAAETVELDVAVCEEDRRSRSAAFAAAAGLIDDVKMVHGRARLTTLLPPDFRDATVSDHVERHVYIQRPPDGSRRTWEYLASNGLLSVEHCPPTVREAAVRTGAHESDGQRGSLRRALHGTQYKLWAGIDPRPGLGYRVIARQLIPAGSFVYEYAGHYLPIEESEAKYNECFDDDEAAQQEKHRYVFTILRPWAKEWDARRAAWMDSLDTIDAEHAGNVSRLMNHSCEPSMQPFEVFQRRGYFRILFAATRHIYPGDELTIDYMPYYDDEPDKERFGGLKQCLCGATRCRRVTC